MKLRKLLVATIAASFLFSCSQDQIKEQSEGDTANLSVSSLYDYSNLGTYKGVFTTNDSQMRGVIEINSLNNDYAKATLTTNDGLVSTAISAQKVLDGVGVNDLVFNSTSVNGISFKYSISADGSAPVVSDVMYRNAPSSVTIVKETSRAPVVPVTGNYLKDGTSAGDTFSLIFNTGDGTGDDTDITTQIMRNGADIGGSSTGNSQSGCASDGTDTTCDIAGDAMTANGATISWTGTHVYSDTDNCSTVSGTWTSTGAGGATGTFTSDANVCSLAGNFPSTAIPITPSAEGTGCATATFAAALGTGGFTDSGVATACLTGTDIYYSWTATTDALVFTVSSGGGLSTPGTSILDANDTSIEYDCGNGSSFGALTYSGWTVGDELLIRFSNAAADITFCLEEFTIPGVPANDLCGDAEAILCGDSVSGNTVTATNSDGDRGNDVWYSLDGTTTTAGDNIALSLCTSGFDTYLLVLDACSGGQVAFNDDNNAACGSTGPSFLEFTSDGATEYIIRVDGWGAGDNGAYTLDVTCTPGTGTNAPVTEEEVIHPAKLAAMNER